MTNAKLIIGDGCARMSPEISIVPTNPDHIAALKRNLRPEDRDEILKVGIKIEKALWQSYRHSVIRKTAFIDNDIAACWGCGGTFLGQKARPWLMTTPKIKEISPLKFARIYQSEVHDMLKMFPRLENFVDAEYDGAVRLLDIVGFTIEKGVRMAETGALYRKFWINA